MGMKRDLYDEGEINVSMKLNLCFLFFFFELSIIFYEEGKVLNFIIFVVLFDCKYVWLLICYVV